jgi:hypothetical protein
MNVTRLSIAILILRVGLGGFLLVAIPAAFLAGWPVNPWLLKKELRAPHSTTALCD